jgi:hypothetical protein
LTHPNESQPAPPEEEVSLEEMRDALLKQLYKERASLKGVALVQGLKALAALVQQDKAEPEKADVAEPHSLLDQIKNVPAAHARKLLTAELARLGSETAAHQAALDELEGK